MARYGATIQETARITKHVEVDADNPDEARKMMESTITKFPVEDLIDASPDDTRVWERNVVTSLTLYPEST